jgi:acyl-CoA thioesterase FadM
MSELRVTHESTVTEDQIDHLGHMNVRFYAVNAQAGTRAVLAGLPGWDGRPHVVHDIYTRHHREQLLGTPLVVRSAVIGVGAGGVRLFHELAAADSETLAATFVHGISPVDGDGYRLPLDDELVAAIEPLVVPAPEHATTRTISLDVDLRGSAPSLDTLRQRGLAVRKVREVQPDECDASGRYRIEMAPMLTWGGEPVDDERGDMVVESPDGRQIGWALMETRVVTGRLPSAGDRVQSFGAVLAVHDKVFHRLYWSFAVDTGELLTAFEAVNMAFDIAARRPVSIPDAYRRREESKLQPDLVPTPTT